LKLKNETGFDMVISQGNIETLSRNSLEMFNSAVAAVSPPPEKAVNPVLSAT